MLANKAILPLPDHRCAAVAVGLAEDDHCALANILQGTWTVKFALNCQEALDISSREPVHFVLCSPLMRDGTWITLLDRLSQRPASPALIVVSRLADWRLCAEVLSLGGYDVLMTPFDRDEVRRVCFLACMASQREPPARDAVPMGQAVTQIVAKPATKHAAMGQSYV